MQTSGNFAMPYARYNHPPANPADQNPPCNTLYVGNLPLDTNEDELKALFSKQRGYKRLCFRVKQNGPMCFVEFEDTSFATKALNELYGHMLHNSIKGGIRLSFSKNPLGVRTGQMNGIGPSSPLSPQGLSAGFNGNVFPPPGFTSTNGPPPGLGGTGRLTGPGQAPMTNGLHSMYPMDAFALGGSPLGHPLRGMPVTNGFQTTATHASLGGVGASLYDYPAGH